MALPNSILGRHVQGQLIRSSTSVAANYRAACIAQSKASFISKLSIVIEEADECSFWLEFIMDENLLPKEKVTPLFTESEELKSEIQSLVTDLNGKFSNPEQLKKFSILPRDFTIDDGELTPTLKIKRKQIRENWSEMIESMYSD